MKQFFISISLIILMASCNQSGSEHKYFKDTSLVYALYQSALVADTGINKVKQGFMQRVEFDTLTYVYADTLKNPKRDWVRDSLYLITYYLPIDSAQSAKLKLPMKDSTGKVILYPTIPIATNKRFVRSGWERADTAIAQLRRIK